jgi:4-aminobutyrate aminotransferase/(S)-3-amino-2-methylpropionate transaminase
MTPIRPAIKEQLDCVLSACRERGVMALPASRSGNVLRILCPLVITEEDLEQALTIIEESVLSLTEKANA